MEEINLKTIKDLENSKDPNTLNKVASFYFINHIYQKAVYFFDLAAQAGNVSAQRNLGIIYKDGYIVEQDYNKSTKYFKMAAKQGDADSLFILGLFYRDGVGNIVTNRNKARKYFKLAIQQGNLNAAVDLGEFYFMEGQYELAKHYFEISDISPLSQQNLGVMYWHGLGVEKNYNEAIKHYTIAAQLGNSLSLTVLGEIYMNGLGNVEKDEKTAVKYFMKAANLGETYALKCINKIIDEASKKGFDMANNRENCY